jgi:hypothetical protein
MFKELVVLANHLDKKGLTKEADYLDNLLRKQADPSDTPFGENPFGEDPFGDLNKGLEGYESIEPTKSIKPEAALLPKPKDLKDCEDYANKAEEESAELNRLKDAGKINDHDYAMKSIEITDKYHMTSRNSLIENNKGICNFIFDGQSGPLIFKGDFDKYSNVCDISR